MLPDSQGGRGKGSGEMESKRDPERVRKIERKNRVAFTTRWEYVNPSFREETRGQVTVQGGFDI